MFNKNYLGHNLFEFPHPHSLGDNYNKCVICGIGIFYWKTFADKNDCYFLAQHSKITGDRDELLTYSCEEMIIKYIIE